MMLKAFIIILIFIGLGTSLTIWRADRNAQQVEADYPPEGDFVTIGDRSIHYLVQGDGPDLILIHGASGSTRDFTYAMAPALAEHYRVIAFDRPGFGYSDRAQGFSIAEQAALLADAADQIGVQAPLIVGQSYGGAVALAWALARDDTAGLVLISAASNPWTTGIGAYYTALSSRAGQAIMAPLLSAWVPEGAINAALAAVFAPNDVPEGYGAHIGTRMSLRLDTMRENALQRRALLGEITDQVTRYRDLSIPVEILHGTADTIVPVQTHSEPLASQLPNAELTLLEGIGHMPHHVALADVLAAIDRAAMRAGLR